MDSLDGLLDKIYEEALVCFGAPLIDLLDELMNVKIVDALVAVFGVASTLGLVGSRTAGTLAAEGQSESIDSNRAPRRC